MITAPEQLFLRRIAFNDRCVQGVLVYQHRALLLTLEDAWRDNLPEVSCIPPGTYRCIRHSSIKFPNTWRLEDVPGRSAILIHAGNTDESTRGCLLVGRRFGDMSGVPAVLESRAAMDQLRYITRGWKEFDLIIEDRRSV